MIFLSLPVHRCAAELCFCHYLPLQLSSLSHFVGIILNHQHGHDIEQRLYLICPNNIVLSKQYLYMFSFTECIDPRGREGARHRRESWLDEFTLLYFQCHLPLRSLRWVCAQHLGSQEGNGACLAWPWCKQCNTKWPVYCMSRLLGVILNCGKTKSKPVSETLTRTTTSFQLILSFVEHNKSFTQYLVIVAAEYVKKTCFYWYLGKHILQLHYNCIHEWTHTFLLLLLWLSKHRNVSIGIFKVIYIYKLKSQKQHKVD